MSRGMSCKARGTTRLCLIVAALAATTPTWAADWPQWGGPSGDFKLESPALADRWPEEGPEKLWSRPLGEGHASIVADAGALYTMYREKGDEVIVALSADTGKTRWEHRCPVTPASRQTAEFGQGPNATPLIIGDRLVTIGFTGLMHCLRLDNGEVLWSHDFAQEYSAPPPYYGYSTSPIAYKGTILALVGGEGYGVVAFNPKEGNVLWHTKAYDVSYAAPILINVDGQDQFVFFTTDKVVGIDPVNGSHLWSHPVVNFCRTNCSSAIWGEDNLLWAATKGVGGTRVLKLTQAGGKTKVEEVWLNRKIRLYHWNGLRVGDYVYASSGSGSTVFSKINVKTGEIVDRQRGFASVNVLYADGKLILLDHAGKLALARPGTDGIKIESSVRLLDGVSWTAPTLVGKTLFVRDRKNILALDLG